MSNFCDYCDCNDCRNGTDMLHHAMTSNDEWICDVCYLYDLCTSGPNRSPDGPCREKECVHRPKIVSTWTKLKHLVIV